MYNDLEIMGTLECMDIYIGKLAVYFYKTFLNQIFFKKKIKSLMGIKRGIILKYKYGLGLFYNFWLETHDTPRHFQTPASQIPGKFTMSSMKKDTAGLYLSLIIKY